MNRETKRRCRECDRVLPSTRYFKCKRCQPNLPEDVGDWLYTFESEIQLEELKQYEYIEREKAS